MSVEFGEYLPNWLSFIVTTLGMIAAALATGFAWRTFTEDRVRDARRDALCVSASWAVISFDGEEKTWGVLVHNASRSAFYDVTITTVGNNHAYGARPISFKQLQPGRYFRESNGKAEKFAWGHQIVIAENDQVSPAGSETKKVSSLEFTDSLGTRWESLPGSGLRPVAQSSAASAATV